MCRALVYIEWSALDHGHLHCIKFAMAQVMLIGEIEEIIEIADEADSVSDTLWTQTGLIGNKR